MKHPLLKFLLPALAVGGMLAACSSGGKKEISEGFYAMQLPVDGREKNIEMSKVADSIAYVPLQTTPECRIENIWKIVPMNDYLVVMDKKTQEHVYLFRTDGAFVREISSKGLAESQFAILSDITADPKTGMIYILDGGRRLILGFDTEGNLVSKTPTLFVAQNFEFVSGDTFALNTNYFNSKFFQGDTPNLILMSLSSGVTGRYVVRPKELTPSHLIGLNANFSRTRDGVTFIAPLCDTVFLATEKQVRPLWLADFGNENEKRNKEYIENVLEDKPAVYALDKLYQETDKVFMTGFQAFDDVAVVTYDKKGRRYAAFFYPESGRVVEGSSARSNVAIPVANDMDGITVLNPLGARGNKMYCITTLGYVEGAAQSAMSPGAKEVSAAYRPGDNPVVAVVSLKTK